MITERQRSRMHCLTISFQHHPVNFRDHLKTFVFQRLLCDTDSLIDRSIATDWFHGGKYPSGDFTCANRKIHDSVYESYSFAICSRWSVYQFGFDLVASETPQMALYKSDCNS